MNFDTPNYYFAAI